MAEISGIINLSEETSRFSRFVEKGILSYSWNKIRLRFFGISETSQWGSFNVSENSIIF